MRADAFVRISNACSTTSRSSLNSPLNKIACTRRAYSPAITAAFYIFKKKTATLTTLAFEDTICEVIVMSGFPGVGKDTWIAKHYPALPVISLDVLRAELKIKPTDNQGAVIAAAREKAREYLRRKQSFMWNATNISRQMREHCLSLCAAYNARLRIVYLETSAETLFAQNRARAASVPVPVIHKLMTRWEVPDLTEAHAVEWIVQ